MIARTKQIMNLSVVGLKEDALYYDHTYSVDSTSSSNSAEDLSSLLANQMAQFRKATGVQDELQIFTLENPIDAENLGCCNMVYEALEEAINNRSEINYHITRISVTMFRPLVMWSNKYYLLYLVIIYQVPKIATILKSAM